MFKIKKEHSSWFMSFAYRNQKGIATLSSVILGLVVSCVVLLIMGYNPFEIIGYLVAGAFQVGPNIWQTIETWSLFVLLGLSVAVGFKAGLFNIGVAGQMVFAATMGYLFVYSHTDVNGNADMNPGVMLAIVVIIALLSAILMGVIVGLLKAFFGVHEVITTIMFNWIAVKLAKGLIIKGNIPSNNSSLQTLPTGVSTTIDSLSPMITWALFAAIIVVIAIFVLFKYTKLGMKIKITGNNVNAGKYAGYKSRSLIIGVMVLSSLIAGVAALAYYFGERNVGFNYLATEHFSFPPAIGFTGVAIALIALNNPIAIVPVAFIFAVTQGDASLNGIPYGVPREIGQLFGSIIVYFVAISNIFVYLVTPQKIKQTFKAIKTFLKDKNVKLEIKIGLSIGNTITLGYLSYALKNWTWIKNVSRKKNNDEHTKVEGGV